MDYKDNYYHQLGKLGSYNISNKQVMLDFKGLVGDEFIADFVLTHEGVHAILGVETDFGQVTSLLYQVQRELIFSEKEVKDILNQVYWSQVFVQEGLATIIPFSILKSKVGKDRADQWAGQNIANTQRILYKTYFHQLYFVSDLSVEQRSKFTGLISSLVMESGFRKTAPQEDLLKSPETLAAYLGKIDYNPNKRFEKAVDYVSRDLSILDLPIPDMAKAIGIPYLPATKAEVAKFMTYLLSKTKHPMEYKEEYVGDRPEGTVTLNDTFEKMVVANINLDLEKTSEVLFNPADFLFMSDDMEVIFVHKVDEHLTDIAFLKSQSKENPEVGLIGFIPNREKYMTFVSKETAADILNGKLKDKTMVLRFEDYDIKTMRPSWSDKIRQPDIVLYSFPKQMKAFMENVVTNRPETRFQHLHSQFMENNPLQTLFVKIIPNHPIHIVSHYGNKGISEILAVIKQNSVVMDRQYIESNRKTINNLLAFWLGQHWEVDWVSNMFDKTHLFFRNGQVISADAV